MIMYHVFCVYIYKIYIYSVCSIAMFDYQRVNEVNDDDRWSL